MDTLDSAVSLELTILSLSIEVFDVTVFPVLAPVLFSIVLLSEVVVTVLGEVVSAFTVSLDKEIRINAENKVTPNGIYLLFNCILITLLFFGAIIIPLE